MIGVLIIGIGFGICASLLGINLIHRYYYKDFKPDIGELSEEDWEEIVTLFEEGEEKNGKKNE